MARQARLTIPGYAHHVIQRGNNRQAIFEAPADYQFMLGLLDEDARKFRVNVHAYVLMPNHFHLLLTPQEAQAVPRMMQAVGRRYVRYFNQRQSRSGTLWEGRYRSTLIQPESYLLACMAYIDLNPVRAGISVQPRDYPWSSHVYCVGLRPDPLMTPHALYWNLGNTPFAREAAYAALVERGLEPGLQQELTQAVLSGWALGDQKFAVELQEKTKRRVVKASAGRPRATQAN
jgi:putative transposase